MTRGVTERVLVRATVVVVLCTMISVARAAAAPVPNAAQDSTSSQRPVPTRRPFAHERHTSLPCRGCHGSGATHGAILVRAPGDCAACHHDPRRGLACTSCHSANDIPVERTVRLSLPLQVATAPLTRDVTFPHALHVARNAGLVCADCHGAEVTRPKNVRCGSCHGAHHDGRVECTNCHVLSKAAVGAHDASVHLTCSNGACHASVKAPTPTAARSVCLFCHADRKTHEPEGSCAACHRIPTAGGRAP
jgi:hypothetical protein